MFQTALNASTHWLRGKGRMEIYSPLTTSGICHSPRVGLCNAVPTTVISLVSSLTHFELESCARITVSQPTEVMVLDFNTGGS